MSETEEPAIRMIDLNEHPLVVIFNDDGSAHVTHHGMCPTLSAEWLERLAAVMREQHPPFPCHWIRAEEEPAVRDDEPINADGGQLDKQRRVWTDGTGHRWDLSVPWDDVTGVRWSWTGRFDRNGAPLMRSADGVEVSPLDVVRAVTGPIVPAVGDAS